MFVSTLIVSLLSRLYVYIILFFFLNDTPTTKIYTLSLHDALPISSRQFSRAAYLPCRSCHDAFPAFPTAEMQGMQDRKSTRLNSSHMSISYAVFCLKKKKNKKTTGY